MARTKQTARKSTGGKAPRKMTTFSNVENFPRYEEPTQMTQSQTDLIQLENHYRNLFAENRNHHDLDNDYLLLGNAFHDSDFEFQEEDPDEFAIPKLLCQDRPTGLTGSAIVDRDTFERNLKELTQGCLDGLDWSNVFLAGGAVLGCLSRLERDKSSSSDLDLFLCGIETEDEADRKLAEIYNLVVANTGCKGDIIRTNNAVTIIGSYPYRHVQVICRLYKSPAEVLLGFDIDSCCVGYNGTDVYYMERFRRALTKRYNLVNPSRRSSTYESRLYKYSKRGFAVAVPGLNKNKISEQIFNTKNLRNSSGLMKLVLYDYREINGSLRSFPRIKKDEEGSDYNNDIVIPWGPGLSSERTIQMVKSKDKSKFFSTLHQKKTARLTGKDLSESAQYNPLLVGNVSSSIGSGDSWRRGLDGREVKNRIQWLKTSPAYQDIDNNYRRLMTGSFNPIFDEAWDDGLYEDVENDVITYNLSRNDHNEQNKPVSVQRNQVFQKTKAKKVPAKTRIPGQKPALLISGPGGFGQSSGGFGLSSGFSPIQSSGGFGETTGGFGQSSGGFGQPSGFSPIQPSGGFSQSSGGFGQSSGGFGQPSGFSPIQPSSGFGQPSGFSPVPTPQPTFGQSPPSFGQSPGFGSSEGGFSGLSSASPFGTKRQSLGKSDPEPSYPIPQELYQHIDQSASTFDFDLSNSLGPQPTGFSMTQNNTDQNQEMKMSLQELQKRMQQEQEEQQKLQQLHQKFGSGQHTIDITSVPLVDQTSRLAQENPHMITGHGFHPSTPDFNTGRNYAGFTGFSPLPQTNTTESQRERPASPSKFGPQPGTRIKTAESTMPQTNRTDEPKRLAQPNFASEPSPLQGNARASTKLLLLVSLAFRQGQINNEEKSKFKDMIIMEEPLVLSALEVFEIDHDLDEFVDTIRRICLLK